MTFLTLLLDGIQWADKAVENLDFLDVWKAIHGNVNQTTFQELQKFALCENQKVAIEPKLASCILVVLAGCLTAAFVWFTFICR